MDADAASREQGRAFRGGPGEDVLFAGHGARHLESIKAKVDFVDAAGDVVAAYVEDLLWLVDAMQHGYCVCGAAGSNGRLDWGGSVASGGNCHSSFARHRRAEVPVST